MEAVVKERGRAASPAGAEYPARYQLPEIESQRDQVVGPLSLGQERLWFLDALHGPNAAHDSAIAFELVGVLNLGALAEAVRRLSRRHPALRTVVTSGRTPKQEIRAHAPELLTIHEVEANGAALSEMVGEVRSRHPALRTKTGRLVAFDLLRLDEERHALILSLDGCVSDERSLAIIVDDLGREYKAILNGQSSDAQELASYIDFTHWQHSLLERGLLDKQLAYWEEKLSDFPSCVDIPTDYPRPVVASYSAETINFAVPRGTCRRLRQWAVEQDSTARVVVLTAFAILLSRYASADDVVIGVPDVGRYGEALEGIVGRFENSLVLRVKVDERLSFQSLLQRVHETWHEAQENRHVPFEYLLKRLGPVRSLGHAPVFQIMLDYQNSEPIKLEMPGIVSSEILMFRNASECDVTVKFAQRQGCIVGELTFRTDLFAQKTMEKLVADFIRLLDMLICFPERPIALAEPVAPENVDEKVARGPQLSGPGLPLADRQLRVWARREPDRIAVRCGGKAVSYAELEQRVDMGARALCAAGAGQGARIGVAVERSIELIATILSVMRAGATYVPLDPRYPIDRLRFIAEDAELAIGVSDGTESGEFLQNAMPHAVWLKAGDLAIDTSPNVPTAWQEPRSDLDAYLIYTSGSTGLPKGVAVTRSALANFLDSMQKTPGMSRSDRLLAVTTHAFDISILELLLPIVVGAEVVIATDAETIDPRRVEALVQENHITIMQATPTTWRLLEDIGWNPPSQLRVLAGGEAVPGDLVQRLLSHVAEVWNMYGPTEATIWTAARRLDVTESAKRTDAARIGGAVQNTQLYVLDSLGRLVADGVQGELAIGGLGVARGYWKRPRQTAERFIPDPFSDRPGARLYLTGDLVRRHADSTIEFLGRLDHQVKVRGHRIELGEVESALRHCRGVADAAAVVRRDGPWAGKLLAYVVRCPGSAMVDIPAVKRELKGSLPSYMMPSAIIELDMFPLTNNLKVDRNALPVPETRGNHESRFAGETEDLIRTLWVGLLGHSCFGPRDCFFDIGGDSFLALQMAEDLKGRLIPSVDVIDLFEHASVRELATYIDAKASLIGADARMIEG